MNAPGQARRHAALALALFVAAGGCKNAAPPSNTEGDRPGDTEAESDSRTDTGDDTDDDTGSAPDTGSPPDSGGHCVDPVGDTDTASDPAGSDLETESHTESHTEGTDDSETTGSDPTPDTASDTEQGTGGESDNDTPTDSETGTGLPVDTETEPWDTGPETDSESPPTCPEDMVLVQRGADADADEGFCIDRYEASRADATETAPGTDEAAATSRPGVLPWYVNPMTAGDLTMFQTACAAAGKHLCEADEWFTACTGPEGRTYAFGDTFSSETCNCVDTFCDDYCIENGIPLEDCNRAANCGYDCGDGASGTACFRVLPTGAMGDCTSSHGAFDVAGNVWEVVPSEQDSRGFEIRGGAFNCASAATRLRCDYNAGWEALYAGFRCCKAPTQ